jgi:hypothetical protein
VRLRLSLLPALDSKNPPTLVERDLDGWAELLRPRAFAEKAQAPILSPGEFTPGQRRLAEHLRALHAVVLDIDHAQLLDVRRVFMPLLEGRAAIVYSSWSHAAELAQGRACLRVILPTSRPVLPAEWQALWAATAARVGGGVAQPREVPRGLVDRKCHDPAHVYYVPAHPPGGETTAYFRVQHGAALDVDTMLAAGPCGDMPTTVVLDELADTYARRRTDAAKDIGGRLRKLARGEAYAGPGERDDAAWRLACVLAREFPDAGETLLSAVLEPSLERMRTESPGDGADSGRARDKIKRAIEAAREAEDKTESDRDRRARVVLRAAGREHCYTQAEIADLMQAAGARDEIDLARRWVIQEDGNFYILEHRDGRPGYVGPFTARSLSLAAEVRLAAAESAGVMTWTEHQGKRRTLAGPEIAQRYGMVADRVVTDLAAQCSTFDGRTLIRAPCPRRDIVPARSDVVEAWLAAACGEALPRVLDWMSVVTDLRRECAALYLYGKKGAGKGLLAHGLARIWTEGGPPDLEDVLPGSWNDRVLSCPLAFADERIPKDMRGHVRTEELRSFISARSRTLRVKYSATGEVRAALRLIIAANNQTLLQAGANLTQHDIEAIAERLLYVEVSPAGSEYLTSLPFERRERLVYGDEIAAHALWLSETRAVERNGRFLVAGGRDEVVTAMTVAGGLRSALLNWIVLWLLDPNRLAGRDAARVVDGEVLVSARMVQECWGTYEVNMQRAPNASEMQNALKGICREGTRQLRSTWSGRARYWIVDKGQIEAWCKWHQGHTDWDEVRERIDAMSAGGENGPWNGARPSAT